jgi:hypothetical protein
MQGMWLAYGNDKVQRKKAVFVLRKYEMQNKVSMKIQKRH